MIRTDKICKPWSHQPCTLAKYVRGSCKHNFEPLSAKVFEPLNQIYKLIYTTAMHVYVYAPIDMPIVTETAIIQKRRHKHTVCNGNLQYRKQRIHQKSQHTNIKRQARPSQNLKHHNIHIVNFKQYCNLYLGFDQDTEVANTRLEQCTLERHIRDANHSHELSTTTCQIV